MARHRRRAWVLVVALVLLTACGDDGTDTSTEDRTDDREDDVATTEPATDFTLSSSAFAEGATIPDRHSCRGDDLSPALEWTDPPAATASFAVVMDDPDAVPVAGFVWDHWVLWGIPAEARALPEAIPSVVPVPSGGTQGENSFGRVGYGGPCPPEGQTHTYVFVVYALDTELEPAGPTKADLLAAVEGHILAEATLTGTFTR